MPSNDVQDHSRQSINNPLMESGLVKHGRIFQVLTSPKRGTFKPVKEKHIQSKVPRVGKENEPANIQVSKMSQNPNETIPKKKKSTSSSPKKRPEERAPLKELPKENKTNPQDPLTNSQALNNPKKMPYKCESSNQELQRSLGPGP